MPVRRLQAKKLFNIGKMVMAVVSVKSIGERKCVSPLWWLQRSCERGTLFPSNYPFPMLIVSPFLLLIPLPDHPRIRHVNGDGIEDLCGVHILIFDGFRLCCMFSCAACLNWCWHQMMMCDIANMWEWWRHSLYANAPATSTKRLQSLINMAARIVSGRSRFDHISDFTRDELHWLPIRQRIDFKICS